MDTATKGNASSATYDEHYYLDSCGGPVPYERNDYWLGIFHGIADQIVRSLQPRRVFDAGCAKGFLVEALWERGVEAQGIDISEYAISQVRKDIQAFCRCVSLIAPIEGRFDLVTCFEVLEHIPKTEERQVLSNLISITDTILFSSTPTDMSEPTHVNVRPTIGWLNLFAEFDFAPVLNFDAGFVAPHAILFRRTAQATGQDVLALYANLIRYKVTLTDRHNKIAHLQQEAQHLQQELALSGNHITNLDKQIAANAKEIVQLRQQLASNQRERGLSTQDTIDLQIASSVEEIAHVRRGSAEASREIDKRDGELQTVLEQCMDIIDRVSSTAEHFSVRFEMLESRIAEVARQNQEILRSRIWRTFCAGGAMLLAAGSLFTGRSKRQHQSHASSILNSKPARNASSATYDEHYYLDSCGGPVPYERNDYWLGIFHGIADQIVRSLQPRRVFDAGCAKGFLVEALWERGVEAQGIDISEYAISQVRKDIQAFCRCVSLIAPIEGRFDLVTCFEVLEHIPKTEERQVLSNLISITDTILFSSTPTDMSEPTHVNVRPTIGWLNLFAEFDFAPVLNFDAGFVAPHAILFRRTAQATGQDVLALYANLIRYKVTLTDRHNKIAHLQQEAQHLQQELALSGNHITNLDKQIAANAKEIVQLRQQLASNQRERGLSTQDTIDLQIASSVEEIAHVRRGSAEASREIDKRDGELQTVLEQCTDIIDRVSSTAEHFSVRFEMLESRIAEVARQNQEILRSRIWRTFCAGGAMLLAAGSLFTGRSKRQHQSRASSILTEKQSSDDFFGLVCDELQPRIETPRTETPRTGQIAVRGWALAASGLESIQIHLGTACTFAKTGLSRPDVGCIYPDMPEARTAGFHAEIDTSTIPSGHHTLSIRAVSRSGAVRRIEHPVFIDHEKGWASDYDRWIAEFEKRNPRLIELKMRTFTTNPLISIVMPVYRTPGSILRKAILSVTVQSYPKWELCIADDGSESSEVQEILERYAQQEPRIKTKYLKARSGIALCTNAALELASGDFIALLDHDDELAEDALFYVIEALNRQPDLDILYSDEDKIDEHGRRYDPFFKPNWSPDLILSENYIAHLLVCRRELLIQAGAFRPGFDGSQDHDLVLRLAEKSDRVFHISRILYHWRATASSTASVSTQKTYAAEAARQAIQDHLERCAIVGKVVPGCFQGRWRVRYGLKGEPAVSLIIASGGRVDILRTNLESVFDKTEYRNFEVVVIDNSKKDKIEKLVTTWPSLVRPLRYIDWRDKDFNYAAINNEAARRCNSPILLFLNDDTSVITGGWITAMVEMAVRPEVGAVGAKLLYPNGRIQHAGVVMGIFGNCGHAFKGLPADTHHYFDFPDVIRNVSAVTGACLMTRADVFHQVGGFDETTFAVAFNDIDLCLKIRERGYRVIYTPHALLYHHEAFSKTAKDVIPDSKEVKAMQAKWKAVIEADPYYNENLTRSVEDYSLARKDEILSRWRA